MAVEIAAVGRPWKLPWQLPRTFADFCGDCRVSVAMAAVGRGNCHDSSRGNSRGNCCGLPWVAMTGTTECATDRTTARAMAILVAFTVEVP